MDASVVIWGAGDEADPKAAQAKRLQLALGKKGILRAPMMLAYEVGEWLRRNEKAPQKVLQAMEGLLSDIALVAPTFDFAARTIEAAVADGLSFYDASYLSVALSDPTSVLVTEDRALLRAATARLGAARAFDIAGAFSTFVLSEESA